MSNILTVGFGTTYGNELKIGNVAEVIGSIDSPVVTVKQEDGTEFSVKTKEFDWLVISEKTDVIVSDNAGEQKYE